MHELRSANDPHSLKQADLITSGLSANGNDTLLDIGRTHPLIDTNLSDQSLGNRAYAADKYAASKDRRYRRIINANNLPYVRTSRPSSTSASASSSATRRTCWA